jgi:hypothetical protein
VLHRCGASPLQGANTTAGAELMPQANKCHSQHCYIILAPLGCPARH